MAPESPHRSLLRQLLSWRVLVGLGLVGILVTGAFSTPRETRKPDAARKEDAKQLHDLALRAEREGRHSDAVDLAEKSLDLVWNQPDLIALLNRIAERQPELKAKARRVAVRYETMVRLLEKGPITAKDIRPPEPPATPPAAPRMPAPGTNQPPAPSPPGLPGHLRPPGGTGVPKAWKPPAPQPGRLPR